MPLPETGKSAAVATAKLHQRERTLVDLADGSLLIVDDDRPFALRLERAMAQRGFLAKSASSQAEARALIHAAPPAFAIVDLRLGDGGGLDLVQLLTELRPDSKAVVLTGYGNFTSVVRAMKLGAISYLAKPAEIEEIVSALIENDTTLHQVPELPISAERVKWEHIMRIFELCNGNISDTARRLHMHRRTLQRMLSKRAPR